MITETEQSGHRVRLETDAGGQRSRSHSSSTVSVTSESTGIQGVQAGAPAYGAEA